MSVYAVGDLHLSGSQNKTMDMFGENWVGHWNKIQESWLSVVEEGDTVLIPGDISWAMYLEEVIPDLNEIGLLPGKKILLKGNHDYWWQSLNKINAVLPSSIKLLQNNCIDIGDEIICGTRGWSVPGSSEFLEQDRKIYLREVERLRLSISSVKEDKEIIVIMHYPPYNDKCEFNEFINVLMEYDIKRVLFGHIHGTGLWNLKEGNIFGIDFSCVSCDYLNFKLKKIK